MNPDHGCAVPHYISRKVFCRITTGQINGPVPVAIERGEQLSRGGHAQHDVRLHLEAVLELLEAHHVVAIFVHPDTESQKQYVGMRIIKAMAVKKAAERVLR